MNTTVARRLLCLPLVAISFGGLISQARGAEATITYPFPSIDSSGITASVAAGIAGCLVGCSTMQVTPRTALPARRQSVLQFAAPAGTTIQLATIRLRYRTKAAGVSARVRSRINGRWFDGQRLRSAAGVTSTISAGRGATAVGVALVADTAVSAKAVRSATENMVTIGSVALVVRDLLVPTVGWIGAQPEASGWQRGTVCATAGAQDVGLGIDHIEYAIGSVVTTETAPTGVRLQPRPLNFTDQLCVDTAQVGDGTYGTSLTAVDTSATGNRSSAVIGLISIDNTPPSVSFVSPPDTETRTPALVLNVEDRTSGVADVSLSVDGFPLSIKRVGSTVTATTVQPLSDGLHRVAWEVLDVAGNSTTGAETVAIADLTPPTVDQALPQGNATSLSPISARIVDTGAGVAADGVRLAVDGIDVTAMLELTAGIMHYQSLRPWTEGDHVVRMIATDKSGNRSVAEWAFNIPITPAPAPTPAPVTATPEAAPQPVASDTETPVPSRAVGRSQIDAPVRFVTRGSSVPLLVEVSRDGLPAAGARLQLHWNGKALTTQPIVDESGQAAIRVPQAVTGTLTISLGRISVEVSVQPAPAVRLTTRRMRVVAGGAVTLSGTLVGSDLRFVRIEARVAGRWLFVTQVPVSRRGVFGTPVRLERAGAYLVRASAGRLRSSVVRLVAR